MENKLENISEQIMKTLQELRFKGPGADDDWVRAYDNEWHGVSGIIAGLKSVWDDSPTNTVTFVVADHHLHGDRVYKVLKIGIGDVAGEPRWRYCGVDGEPNGVGSHTLCHDFDLQEAVASLAYYVGVLVGREKNVSVYRQP